jgi:hypothetical protein
MDARKRLLLALAIFLAYATFTAWHNRHNPNFTWYPDSSFTYDSSDGGSSSYRTSANGEDEEQSASSNSASADEGEADTGGGDEGGGDGGGGGDD